MVRQGEPANQTVKEIAQDVEVEITRVARLAREADKVTEKRHQGLQVDSGALGDEAEDGVPSGGHHPKYNRQRPKTTLGHSTRKSDRSSDRANRSTTRPHAMLWPPG
jgi:hypothetical protein